ncbi:MAG: class I SAM-dependent methyltransferase [Veillonellaceae bacterium]|nr:class I SAM-dependent methyltransferase [Veillonellaceae bacterium]
MISHTVCPLCSSGLTGQYLKCTDNLLTKEEYDIYRCNSCGFVFTNGYPEEENIGRYYDSGDYISHEDSAKGTVNRIYILAREIMLRRKKKLIKKITGLENGSLLDIGCGTGHFAGMMKKSGWDVTGIEPGTKAREYGIQKFGIRVVHPSEISELPDRSFDCITLWHVMEHFHDPSGYAVEMRRLLKPGGKCIVALPNCNSSDADFFREHWAAWDVPRHLWHFNPDTFRRFAEKEGFSIDKTMVLPLDVFYISILSFRNKGSGIPLIRGIVMGKLFFLKSLFRKEKGSSLIYVLHMN